MRAIQLKTRRVPVNAPRELCFEVVAAAGRLVERRSKSEVVVEFTSSYRGREVVTRELVTLEPHTRIGYRWLEGPLPDVREEIRFQEESGRTELVYSGTLSVGPGFFRWLAGLFWIKPRFDRIVLEHLEQAKTLAEKRAARSHIY